YTGAISVQCPTKRYIVILFQPVTLNCNFQTTATQPPVVTWKYKSYCRDPIQAALNPSSAENILSQNNPNYDPNIECADSQRTLRIVASKQANAVTLGAEYQGRKISIINNADLNIGQTAWGDSGVYVCSVISAQDLSGNSEDYTELIVLDWLLVVLVVFGFLLLLLLVGICWCQCCPHTCCCYVSCPLLAPTAAACPPCIMYAQPAYSVGGQPGMPLLPLPSSMHPQQHNGYGQYDGASSGEVLPPGGGKADNPWARVLRFPFFMTGQRKRTTPPPLRTVYDEDEAMSTISSVSQHAHRRGGGGGGGGQGGGGRGGGGYMEARGRARSMDNLDDIDRRYPRHHDDGPRGRRG
ncbi:hypothetical protein CRUP_003928, partial [Coryphaenoides rupestris]